MQITNTLFALCWMLPVVLGAWAPVYLFNNGIVQDGMDCPGDEWSLVKETMVDASHDRRTVRRLGQDRRELNHKCSRCGSFCAFVGHGCAGKTTLDGEDDRRLQPNMEQCATDVAAINASLAALMPSLSQKCQELLTAPRNVSCVQTTMNCHIDSISLWYAYSRKLVMSNFTTDTVTNFCGGALPLTFRADTDYNLGSVSFVMNGPGGFFSNRTASVAPYFMHESLSTSAATTYSLPGMRFPPGDYTLSVSADGDTTSSKTYRFKVNRCIGPML